MAHTQPTQTQHRHQADTEDTEDTDTEDTDTEALRTTWLAEQARVRERIVEADSCSSGLAGDTWSYVGGLDISFIVGDDQGLTLTQIIVNTEH